MPAPAGRLGRAPLAVGLALLVVLADQASKAWMLGAFDLADRSPVDVLPFFRLTLVWNAGVSFGMLTAHSPLGKWLLVGFASAVVCALAAFGARAERRLTAAALGLVMGGAVGNNIIDRVRFGAVVDFLDFSGLGFKWVFNVADSAITVGVALLALDMILTPSAAPADRA